MTDPRTRGSGKTGLRLIAAFKLTKGLVLLGVGVGAVRLLHKDVADVVASWTAELHVDPANRYVDRLLQTLWSVDDRTLRAVSIGTFFYAALLLTEGIGLWLGKRWAEYFTVIVTGSFIPIEVYELVKHFTVTRWSVIAVNVAVVWYLVVRLRHERGGLAG